MLVAPRHVHRVHSDQTLLRTAAPLDVSTAVAEMKSDWLGNSYYRDQSAGRDMALLRGMEAIRQLETLAAHEYYDVEPGTKFVLRAWRATAGYDRPVTRQAGTVSLVRDGGGVGSRVEYVSVADLGATTIYMDKLSVSYVSAELYRKIRYNDRVATVLSSDVEDRNDCLTMDPTHLGLDGPHHVAVGVHTATGRLCLAANPADPAFFDHEQDHWPGMVSTEAAVQAAHHVLGRTPRCLLVDARFHRYLELSETVFIDVTEVVRTDTETTCVVRFEQAGTVGAIFQLSFEN